MKYKPNQSQPLPSPSFQIQIQIQFNPLPRPRLPPPAATCHAGHLPHRRRRPATPAIYPTAGASPSLPTRRIRRVPWRRNPTPRPWQEESENPGHGGPSLILIEDKGFIQEVCGANLFRWTHPLPARHRLHNTHGSSLFRTRLEAWNPPLSYKCITVESYAVSFTPIFCSGEGGGSHGQGAAAATPTPQQATSTLSRSHGDREGMQEVASIPCGG